MNYIWLTFLYMLFHFPLESSYGVFVVHNSSWSSWNTANKEITLRIQLSEVRFEHVRKYSAQNSTEIHFRKLWWFLKEIKNGCPCIVELQGTQGCALVGDPTQVVGES